MLTKQKGTVTQSVSLLCADWHKSANIGTNAQLDTSEEVPQFVPRPGKPSMLSNCFIQTAARQDFTFG